MLKLCYFFNFTFKKILKRRLFLFTSFFSADEFFRPAALAVDDSNEVIFVATFVDIRMISLKNGSVSFFLLALISAFAHRRRGWILFLFVLPPYAAALKEREKERAHVCRVAPD